MYIVVIWYNPNNNSFYYRKYSFLTNRYEIGFKNNYGHEVVLIIDLTSHERISLKRRIVDKLIYHLKNIR